MSHDVDYPKQRIHSKPRISRRSSVTTLPYVSQAETLILNDGAVGGEAAELLEEFVHPHRHGAEETLIGSDDNEPPSPDLDDELGKRKPGLPWWKLPSPWWLLSVLPFTAIAMSATLAPRIEIYTMLACRVHKPDIFHRAVPRVDLGYNKRHVPNAFLIGHDALINSSMTFQPVYSASEFVTSGQDVYHDVEGSPARPNLCASDPVVQAEVAKLTAVITACMGVLSLLTTGWWGAFSDRYGRTAVMGISVIGLLLTDFNFINVYFFSEYMPGGYWFLVIGPLIEGSLGGFTSGVAAMHGYIADTTTEATRAHIFSLNLGLLFTGMALGPTLGGLLIRFTGQTISVFYVAASLHVLYAILVWVILPESLSRKHMQRSKLKYDEELRIVAHDRLHNPAAGVLIRVKRLFKFLSPLTIFMPDVTETTSPLKKPKKDWNLTFMALGYGFTISMMGSYTYTFQYAASTFGWTSEKIGYWISLVGAGRAMFLTIILPIVIKLFKPKPLIIVIPTKPTERQPLLSSASSSTSYTASRSSTPPKPITKEIHSPAFELGVAKVSLVIEAIAYAFMGLAPTALPFTLFGMLGAMGVGFSPAVQTATLAMYSRKGGTEVGRLFGALSVVQALCSQILGPSVYGLVFVKTVAVYPRAIFFVAVSSLVISLFFFSLVRLPKDIDVHRDILEAHSRDLEEQDLDESVSLIREGALVDDDGVGSSLEGNRKRTVASLG